MSCTNCKKKINTPVTLIHKITLTSEDDRLELLISSIKLTEAIKKIVQTGEKINVKTYTFSLRNTKQFETFTNDNEILWVYFEGEKLDISRLINIGDNNYKIIIS